MRCCKTITFEGGKWACPAFFLYEVMFLRQRQKTEDIDVLTKREQSLLDALEPHALAEGIEIVTLEIVGSKKAPTIRVYIDTEDGVGFDELSHAQAWINQLMDEIDPFPGAYMLEVSSPGIDRPLRTLEHFKRFAGDQAVIKTTSPIDGRSTFSGTLVGVEGESVLIEVEGIQRTIPYSTIKKANIKGTIVFN